jgi:hypothetical protein
MLLEPLFVILRCRLGCDSPRLHVNVGLARRADGPWLSLWGITCTGVDIRRALIKIALAKPFIIVFVSFSNSLFETLAQFNSPLCRASYLDAQ